MINLGTIQRTLLAPLIPVIKITGVIDPNQTAKVAASLKKISPARSKALAVVINSPGGSPVQSELICQKLKNYCHQHNLPLYTFADDLAASGGYYILCIGDKVFVDNSSLVGSIGAVTSVQYFKKTLEDQKIHVHNFTSREELLSYKVSPFREDLSEEDRKVLLEVSKKTHDSFVDHVEAHRKTKISVNQSQRAEQVYNADVWLGKKAVDLGLADRLGNYQSELYKEFPTAKIVNVSTKSTVQKYRDAMGTAFNYLASSDSPMAMSQEQQLKTIFSKYSGYLKK